MMVSWILIFVENRLGFAGREGLGRRVSASAVLPTPESPKRRTFIVVE